MKECRYCYKKYPESHFGVALTTPEKVYRRHKCKDCYRKTKKRLRWKYRDWILNYKEKIGCRKCGIKDPRVLEFHHEHGEKEFGIASFTNNGYGLDKIKKEVQKCDVLCANCHRILHFNERGKTK